MNRNEQYKNELLKIAQSIYFESQQSGIFDDEEIREIQNYYVEKVKPLLNSKKPKVMVYGIYNSGKSTLVNAICKAKVAEVADRPMTDTVTEYDTGKYLLVDSPGVNAPIEHEEIADKHLEGCHIILFVISSKGIFEDRVNYEKMYALIKKDIPFYIVLNDRGFALPKKETDPTGEKRVKAIKEHKEELNRIKRKIIANLITISGDSKIADKYEVIVLNAKRAWLGIEKNKPVLVENSQIQNLTNRIDYILDGNGALKQLLAPVSMLEQQLAQIETRMLKDKLKDEDFAVKRNTVENKLNVITESFLSSIHMHAEKHMDEIYASILQGTEYDVENIWIEICNDVEENYKIHMMPLVKYLSENFEGLACKFDTKARIIGSNYAITDEANFDFNNQPQKRNQQRNPIDYRRDMGVQVQNSGGGSKTLFQKICNIFKSNAKKEQERFEQLSNEVAAYNREAEYRVQEESRRRQDARAEAKSCIDAMAKEMRNYVRLMLSEAKDEIMNGLDNMIAEYNDEMDAAKEFLNKFKEIRNQLRILRENME